MRKTVCVYGILILIYAASNVSCLTKPEIYDLVKDYITEEKVLESSEESDDVGDDAIELTKGPDDNLDKGQLMKQCGDLCNEDDRKSTLEDIKERFLSKKWCVCKKNWCKCFASIKLKIGHNEYRVRSFLTVEYKYYGYEVSLSLDGRKFLSLWYSSLTNDSLCGPYPKFRAAEVCLNLYNVREWRRSMCARLTFRIKLKSNPSSANFNLGCFQIRDYDENGMKGLDSQYDLDL